jgi:pimeloyl-ACP methyl ester carboxylesterase
MGSYAPVNGLQLYYEIHGAGEPLILLHGGVALQTAIRHPEVVRKLVVVAAIYQPDRKEL